MNKASSKQFKRFLQDYVRNQPVGEILEFFHAYVGFCIDPSSLLSPLSKQALETRFFQSLNTLTIQCEI